MEPAFIGLGLVVGTPALALSGVPPARHLLALVLLFAGARLAAAAV